jgi:hypothetical protein
MTYRHLVVLGAVAGVGFTMSLFVAQLAFTDRGPSRCGKGRGPGPCGGGVAALVLGRVLPAPARRPAPRHADEAEGETAS